VCRFGIPLSERHHDDKPRNASDRRDPLSVAVIAFSFLTNTPAQAADDGTVSGIVTNVAGEPVAGACVAVFDPQRLEVGNGCADAAGRYTVAGLPEGYLRVRASAAGYVPIWSYNKLTFETADFVRVPADQVDLAMPKGVGTVRGRLTERGVPVAGAKVKVANREPRSPPRTVSC
jgi:hypothetical protein